MLLNHFFLLLITNASLLCISAKRLHMIGILNEKHGKKCSRFEFWNFNDVKIDHSSIRKISVSKPFEHFFDRSLHVCVLFVFVQKSKYNIINTILSKVASFINVQVVVTIREKWNRNGKVTDHHLHQNKLSSGIRICRRALYVASCG